MNCKRNQQGVVLIVALVFLVSLTAVASALMLGTSTDLKMSGASQEKVEAIQETISAVDETIADQFTGAGNMFTGKVFPQPVNTVTSVNVTDITVDSDTPNNQPVQCPRSRLGSSTNLIECNMLSITVNNNYGRRNTSNVHAEAGIAQQLPKGN